MNGDPDVIGLLHRADWTRLSISAQVSDGSTVLVAPGRRYLEQTPEGGVRGCDGERAWMLSDEARDRSRNWISGPEPPLRTLLCPSWLLRSSRLEVRGPARACGRDGLDIVVTAREGPTDVIRPTKLRIGRTEAIVDAELGILLRVSRTDGDGEPLVTELVSLVIDPVVDAATFAPPHGSVIAKGFWESFGAGGAFSEVWNTLAGLAAGGIGAWIKYSPFGHARAESAADPEAAIPHEDPAPELSPGGRLSGPDVADEILHLLYGSGSAAFAATLHEWSDFGAMLAQVPEAVRSMGFGGPRLLISALEQQAATDPDQHQVSFLRVGGPGRYQIDHRYEAKGRAKTIACDGQRRWLVLRDKVTVGPARPLAGNVADLVDTSWLLECRLSDGSLVMAGDRPAYHVTVTRGDAPWSFSTMFASSAVTVVDAEFGILLSLTSYLGGRPLQRSELRDIAPAEAGEFRVYIPPGLPTEPEAERPDPTQPVTPLTLAGAVAREVGGKAAKAGRDFLRRMGLP